ncbi:MAG: hypothetical protein ABTQ34_04915 [Bdellovibrionales bacterium]
MARISERRAGREDGGYTRVFGHKGLGALMSQVQATAIAAGNELEAMLAEQIRLVTHEKLGKFLLGKLPSGVYVLNKRMIRNHLKAIIGSTKEPDFVVVESHKHKVYAIELKDGDQFDTKKASGEVATIKMFSQHLHRMLLENGIDYTVEIRFCFFNQNNRASIVSGMKGEINQNQSMTGAEFCQLVNIDYTDVLKRRSRDADENLKYFCGRLCAMPDIQAILTENLKNSI